MARRLAIAGAALLAAACGGSDAGDARSVVRDSAGIAIVENAAPDDSAAYDWWRLGETLLDIGGEGGLAGHDLFRVSAALRLADGRVLVANGGTSELRFFDAAGSLLATAGRRGDGPGEFQSLAWLAIGEADSLYAWDGRLNRITVLGPDGSFARDFLFGGPGSPAFPVGRFGTGDFAARLSLLLGANGPPPQGLQRPDIAIIRLDPAGNVIDTIGRFPGAERHIRVAGASGRITSVEVVMPLFGRTPYHVVSGDGLVSATQDEPELRVYGGDGAPRRIIRTGRVPEPITDAHRNALIEKRLATAPEEARERIREGLQSLPAEGTIPPYAALVLGRDGNLWLADYDDGLKPAGRWTVYTPEGRGLARIALPARFTPFDIGPDWILGRELDDLDIEHVRLYRVARD